MCLRLVCLLNQYFKLEYVFLFREAEALFMYEQENRENAIEKLQADMKRYNNQETNADPLSESTAEAGLQIPFLKKRRDVEDARKKLEAESLVKTDILCRGDKLKWEETCKMVIENSFYKEDDYMYRFNYGDEPECVTMKVIIDVTAENEKETQSKEQVMKPECRKSKEKTEDVYNIEEGLERATDNEEIQQDDKSHKFHDGTEGTAENEGIQEINDTVERPEHIAEIPEAHDIEKGLEGTADDEIQEVKDTPVHLPGRFQDDKIRHAENSKIFHRSMLKCPTTLVTDLSPDHRISTPLTLYFSAADQYDDNKNQFIVYAFSPTIDGNNPDIRGAVRDLKTVRVTELFILVDKNLKLLRQKEKPRKRNVFPYLN